MRLYYITNSKIPTEKAFGYGIAKMCEALGRVLEEVVLIVPKRHGVSSDALFDFYHVKKNFRVQGIPSLDLFRYEKYMGKLAYALQTVTFCFSLLRLRIDRADVLYSRNLYTLPLLWAKNKNLFFEIHFLQNTERRLKRLFPFAKMIFTSTGHLRDQIAEFGVDSKRLAVLPDAVDLKAFDLAIDKNDARDKLRLPKEKILLGYTGNFTAMGMDKGIENILRALRILKEKRSDFLFVAMGGLPADMERYTRLVSEAGLHDCVRLMPRVSVTELPLYQKAFDILLMCPPRNEYFAYHVSPLKMFEYMASKRPIVASEWPAMREVLNERNALLVNSDNAETLASAIQTLTDNKVLGEALAEQAFRDVQEYTWEKRARRVVDALGIYDANLRITNSASVKSNSLFVDPHNSQDSHHIFRLLVITQEVDRDDSNLGFFHAWIEKLSNHADHVYVICLEKGASVFPSEHVTLLPLGKERLRAYPRWMRRLMYLYRFRRYIRQYAHKYDGVFIHMNPEYAILGGRFWKKNGKKILLWYVHKSVSWKLKFAERRVDRIFTASKESFRLPSKKVDVVGHGIDTDLFSFSRSPHEKETLRLLTIGRISRSKDLVTLLYSIARLAQKLELSVSFDIVGEPITAEDAAYKKELEALVQLLGISTYVSFIGGKRHGDLPRIYQTHDALLHASKTGSLDKTVLEALATGMPVFSSSEAYCAYPADLVSVFPEGDAEELAERIEKKWISGTLVPNAGRREFVLREHNLNAVIGKIISFFQS